MAEVKVSWLTYDSAATACDVRVSWLAYDSNATPCDVRVSWLAYDSNATPCDVRVSWLCYAPVTEVEAPSNTDQGIAPKLQFTPIRGAVAVPSSQGAVAGSGNVSVEVRSVTTALVSSTYALAGAGKVFVQTTANPIVVGAGATSGSCFGSVQASCCVTLRQPQGSRSGSGGVHTEAGADAVAMSTYALAGSGSVCCETVTDIDEDELLLWFLHRRSLDMLTGKHV